MIDDALVLGYLARLGFSERPSPTVETLKKLHLRHVMSIPYENLDILRGRPLDLTPEGMVRKIAERGRGGYCFELNGAFGHLLRALGYETQDRMGRFWLGETAPVPMRRHRVLRVIAENEEFLCDVGVGIPALRKPLPLLERRVSHQMEDYWAEGAGPFGRMVWQRKKGGQATRFFSFEDARQFDVDFVMPSFWCEKHPDSPFNKAPMLALKTETGRLTLDGNVFREHGPGGVREETLEGAALAALIRERFGIDPER